MKQQEFSVAQHRGPGDAILAWRAKYAGVALTDQEIDSWRDRSIGRAPDLLNTERRRNGLDGSRALLVFPE
jgi:hypothetical protein